MSSPHLKQIIEGRATLSRQSARDLMQQILQGELADLQLSALLGALSARGETPSEIAGFVDAMRTAAVPLPLTDTERHQLVDTCGTGGDASGTFNISTAAALVAAAAGAAAKADIMIAKHGNRAVTSQCGSADVLEALGIPVALTPEQAVHSLRKNHFAFLHAPSLHPAMKTVMPVRRALGIRTVFNILGPLSNPARASAQVMGVYAPHLVFLVAEAMLLLGVRHAFVVHGASSIDSNGSSSQGLDEISISGPTQIAEVRDGAITLSTLTPEDLGLRRAPIAALQGGDASTNAAILNAIFSGIPSPHRDVVLLNSAAVLVTANLAPNLRTALDLAAHTVDSGAVKELVATLARNN